MVQETATGFGRNFWGLTVSNGLFFAGFHMLLPTVPLLAIELGGSSTEVGLIAGIFVFSSVITRLFANALIQALGFRACLLAGIAISFVSVLLYPFAGSVETLLWIRLVHGAGFGIGTTFYVSLVMEFIPAGRRGEGLGYFGLATTVAMAVAPASGLWIIEAFGFTPMFVLSATCEVLSLLALLACSISPSLNHPAAGAAPAAAATEGTSWIAAVVEKGTSRAALMTVLFGAAYGSVLNFVAVYAQEMQSSFAGMFFVIATICIFLARLVTAKAYDLKGPTWVIAPGAVVMGTGLAVLALGSSTTMFLSAASLYGVGGRHAFSCIAGRDLVTGSASPPQRRQRHLLQRTGHGSGGRLGRARLVCRIGRTAGGLSGRDGVLRRRLGGAVFGHAAIPWVGAFGRGAMRARLRAGRRAAYDAATPVRKGRRLLPRVARSGQERGIMIGPDALCQLLFRTTRAISKDLNQRLDVHGLYSSEWGVISLLHQRSPMTQAELSAYLNIEPPAISKTLLRLEKKRLVHRRVGRSRREKIVTLTTSADALFSEWEQIVKTHHRKILRNIRGADRDHLYRILSDVLANASSDSGAVARGTCADPVQCRT